ncbi:MAG: 2-oxo acid dehydrogenase subunit E2 [Planctomycetota bacterium]|nr:2-oxo acid dehydrogenase subunit E2 [Planctomycetota bacterium]
MATEVRLPKQGWSTEEAAFVEWLKKDGEDVRAGEPLFSVETEKAVREIESPDDGILRIPPDGPDEGDIIKVGQVIGYLIRAGETVPTAAATAPVAADRPAAEKAGPVTAATATAVPAAALAVPATGATGWRAVTPRAARRAILEGIDIRSLTGTGRGGRIREADVIAACGAPPASPAPAAAAAAGSSAPAAIGEAAGPVSLPRGREVAINGMRRAIAEQMVRSKTLTAPVTLTTRVDAGSLAALRARYKAAARGPDDPVPSYSDMMIKLVAAALREHPALNARWEEKRIVYVEAIDIALAVDTPDGLIAPVVRGVPGLSLIQLAARTRDLIRRARERRLSTGEMTGGTFTVSNLGAAGIDVFTPIINHPECAVLGMGRIVREPAAVEDRIEIRSLMWLSLTFDHRIVDGAPAARFLDAVRKLVENPPAELVS